MNGWLEHQNQRITSYWCSLDPESRASFKALRCSARDTAAPLLELIFARIQLISLQFNSKKQSISPNLRSKITNRNGNWKRRSEFDQVMRGHTLCILRVHGRSFNFARRWKQWKSHLKHLKKPSDYEHRIDDRLHVNQYPSSQMVSNMLGCDLLTMRLLPVDDTRNISKYDASSLNGWFNTYLWDKMWIWLYRFLEKYLYP